MSRDAVRYTLPPSRQSPAYLDFLVSSPHRHTLLTAIHFPVTHMGVGIKLNKPAPKPPLSLLIRAIKKRPHLHRAGGRSN